MGTLRKIICIYHGDGAARQRKILMRNIRFMEFRGERRQSYRCCWLTENRVNETRLWRSHTAAQFLSCMYSLSIFMGLKCSIERQFDKIHNGSLRLCT